MRTDDDEPTLRIRRDSAPIAPVTESAHLFPSPEKIEHEVWQLHREWQCVVASCQRDIEELRAQVAALLDENRRLRDTLGKVRGPR